MSSRYAGVRGYSERSQRKGQGRNLEVPFRQRYAVTSSFKDDLEFDFYTLNRSEKL